MPAKIHAQPGHWADQQTVEIVTIAGHNSTTIKLSVDDALKLSNQIATAIVRAKEKRRELLRSSIKSWQASIEQYTLECVAARQELDGGPAMKSKAIHPLDTVTGD